LTGTGAGTFQYTWLEDRPRFGGVKQVHNVYLEQGTETGIVAFLALGASQPCWSDMRRGPLGERGPTIRRTEGAARGAYGGGDRVFGFLGTRVALVLPPSTIYFFILAGVTVSWPLVRRGHCRNGYQESSYGAGPAAIEQGGGDLYHLPP
jgi:hypothetical protein